MFDQESRFCSVDSNVLSRQNVYLRKELDDAISDLGLQNLSTTWCLMLGKGEFVEGRGVKTEAPLLCNLRFRVSQRAIAVWCVARALYIRS